LKKKRGKVCKTKINLCKMFLSNVQKNRVFERKKKWLEEKPAKGNKTAGEIEKNYMGEREERKNCWYAPPQLRSTNVQNKKNFKFGKDFFFLKYHGVIPHIPSGDIKPHTINTFVLVITFFKTNKCRKIKKSNFFACLQKSKKIVCLR
jgi:hypothetical protein